MRQATGEEALHSKFSVNQKTTQSHQLLQKEIQSLSKQQLKSTSTDDLVDSLAAKYQINIPAIDDSNPSAITREIDIEVRNHGRSFTGGPAVVKGTRIEISVSYTGGDADIFRMHAGNHTMNYPTARIAAGAIMFSWQGTNLNSAQVKQDFYSQITTIKTHLEGMRPEITNFNNSLKPDIKTAIIARLEKIKRDDDLLDGLGFGDPKGPK